MMKRTIIGNEIIWLQEVDSTNNYASKYARDGKSHGLVIAAHNQTEGKGQRGNSWESISGMNLLFSIVLKPSFLKVQRQFLLSKVAALAVCDVLAPLVKEVCIKWPNDIYVSNCKIAGILIENSFSTSYLDSSIIGIGINVNQTKFTDDIPNPTSLCLETSKEFDIATLLESVCKAFDLRYQSLDAANEELITADYFQMLFRKDNYFSYRTQDEMFRAKIFGVRDSGELILQTDRGELKEFAFKEVSYVID